MDVEKYGNWLYQFGMYDTIDYLGIVVINNHILSCRITEYCSFGVISNIFAKMLISMIDRTVDKHGYTRLVYNEDLKADALLGIILYVLPKIKKNGKLPLNPFSYFHDVIIILANRTMNKENKLKQLKQDVRILYNG